MVEELLYLTWVDVLAATDNHVLDTPGNAVVALLVLHTEVTGMQESVLVYHLGSGLRILVVAFHHVEATAAHFALYAYRTFFSRLGVEHLHLHEGEVAAHRGAALLKGVVDVRLRHSRRRLGESVDAGDGQEHLLAHLFHQFHRAERACHDARAQRTHVEHVEHGVGEFGDEHRGYAV